MGSNDLKRRRAEEAIRQDGKCYWCHVAMTPVPIGCHSSKERKPPTMVTLDHLFGRRHPRRKKPKANEKRWVAACFECNQRRGKEHEAKMGMKWRRPAPALQNQS